MTNLSIDSHQRPTLILIKSIFGARRKKLRSIPLLGSERRNRLRQDAAPEISFGKCLVKAEVRKNLGPRKAVQSLWHARQSVGVVSLHCFSRATILSMPATMTRHAPAVGGASHRDQYSVRQMVGARCDSAAEGVPVR